MYIFSSKDTLSSSVFDLVGNNLGFFIVWLRYELFLLWLKSHWKAKPYILTDTNGAPLWFRIVQNSFVKSRSSTVKSYFKHRFRCGFPWQHRATISSTSLASWRSLPWFILFLRVRKFCWTVFICFANLIQHFSRQCFGDNNALSTKKNSPSCVPNLSLYWKIMYLRCPHPWFLSQPSFFEIVL